MGNLTHFKFRSWQLCSVKDFLQLYSSTQVQMVNNPSEYNTISRPCFEEGVKMDKKRFKGAMRQVLGEVTCFHLCNVPQNACASSIELESLSVACSHLFIRRRTSSITTTLRGRGRVGTNSLPSPYLLSITSM